MAQAPLLLMLEFARAEQGGDPFAFRFDTQEYLVRSEGGAFKSARFAWNSKLLDDLARLRRPRPDPSLIQSIGQMLRRFLETTKWTRDEARILDAVKEGRRVVVSIRSAAAELYALPWELLAIESTGQHVGELPGVLLRYEWPETRSIPESEPHFDAHHLLVAWSAAAGAVPASEHITAIQKGNPRDASTFDVTRDVLSHVSCGRLSRALSEATQEGRPVTILHILAHGSPVGGTFGITLNGDDPDDNAVVVDAGRLRQLLAPYASTLRLVVLAACDSGNSGMLGNQLGSVAQALHRAGIAAVVASRYPLSVSGSIRLTESLYAELLASGTSLESALLATRLRLAEDAAQLDWASLQLYARAADITGTRSHTSPAQAPSNAPGLMRVIMRASSLFIIFALITTTALLIINMFYIKKSNKNPTQPLTRVALIIGNGDYLNAEPLHNAVHDADALNDALDRIGIKPIYLPNGTRAAMLAVLKRFKELAKGKKVALLFYFGHGLAYKDRLYIAPTDERVQKFDEIPAQLIDLSDFAESIQQLRGDEEIGMIGFFIDSCARFANKVVDNSDDPALELSNRKLSQSIKNFPHTQVNKSTNYRQQTEEQQTNSSDALTVKLRSEPTLSSEKVTILDQGLALDSAKPSIKDNGIITVTSSNGDMKVVAPSVSTENTDRSIPEFRWSDIKSSGRGISIPLPLTSRSLIPQKALLINLLRNNVLILYSAQFDQIAKDDLPGTGHSPFAVALLKHIETKGLSLRPLAVRVQETVDISTHGAQRPWFTALITHDLFLAEP